MAHRISQAAERSGVPATTIRYYEDQGLIPPPARAANGYRAYDDHDVERLRFVSRARELDLPVEGLAELVELWDGQECGPVARRLRERVGERLAEAQRRIAALGALAGDLQQVLARLQEPVHDGPCVEGRCPCFGGGGEGEPDGTVDRDPDARGADGATATPVGLPLVEGGERGGEAVACTLAPEQMPERMADWQGLLGRAVGQEPIPGGVSVAFPPDPALAAELTRLAAAEHDCCAFFDFRLRVTAERLALEVTGPADAQPVIAAVFGAPGGPAAGARGAVAGV